MGFPESGSRLLPVRKPAPLSSATAGRTLIRDSGATEGGLVLRISHSRPLLESWPVGSGPAAEFCRNASEGIGQTATVSAHTAVI